MNVENLRFGIQIRPGPLPEIISQTVTCEKYGFDSVWYPDHFVGGNPNSLWPEAYTALTLMATNSSKISTGLGATDALRRHPATIAQAFATLDHLTGGRALLGIGGGEAMSLLPFGISTENLYRKLREAIQVVKLLWTRDHNNPANFDGEFYSLKNAFLQIRPVTRPPIYVGSFGPKMLEMTGELADGWMPFSHTPETYKKCLFGAVKHSAEKAGRSFSEIDPALLPLTQISKDHDKAREQVVNASKRFLVLLPSILKMLDPSIEHPGAPYTLVHWMSRLDKKDMDIITKLAEQVPTELALRTAIWGTPDDVIGQIEDFIGSGCRHFVFGVRGENMNASIALLGEQVLPHFKETR